MKSNARFQLDEKWWDREAPKDLGRASDRFRDALKKFSSADSALNLSSDDDQLSKYDLAELATATKLLDELVAACDAALKEVESLAKSKKDTEPERQTDLDNTVEALKKGFVRAVAEKREEYDSYDGCGVNAPLVTPAAHAAYLKRMLPRLKRMEHNFGFALVSNDPDAQRLLFSKKRGPRSLANNIRNDTRPRLITWGTAVGGGALAGGAYGGMVLVLTLEGKKVPNLARRIRLLFRSLGLSMFNKVVIRQDGVEQDASDETETETALAEVEATDDFSELDGAQDEGTGDQGTGDRGTPGSGGTGVPGTGAGAGVPGTGGPATGEPGAGAPARLVRPDRTPNPEKQRWLELRNALAAKVERAIAVKHPGHPKLKTIWLMAQQAADGKDYAKAVKCAVMLQPVLASYNPPPEPSFDKWLRVRDKLYPAMLKLIRDEKGDPWAYRGAWGASEMYHNENDHETALKALNDLARLIAEGESAQNPREMIPKTPAEEKDFADRLRVKLDIMMGVAGDLVEVYANDPKKEASYTDACGAAADAIRDALADPEPAAPGAPAKARDYDRAFANFRVLGQKIRDAEKAGKRTSTGLKELRKRLDALDARIVEHAHLAVDPELADLFREVNEARGGILAFLRFEDVYGALAGMDRFEAAIEVIEQAAATDLATA